MQTHLPRVEPGTTIPTIWAAALEYIRAIRPIARVTALATQDVDELIVVVSPHVGARYHFLPVAVDVARFGRLFLD